VSHTYTIGLSHTPTTGVSHTCFEVVEGGFPRPRCFVAESAEIEPFVPSVRKFLGEKFGQSCKSHYLCTHFTDIFHLL